MIITIEIARNEKYCLRRSQVQEFDLLCDRLKEAYTRYLEEEYGGEDISQSQIYFGQRLWIKGGKLVFGFTYDVPLEKINARFNEKGYLDIIYRAKKWRSDNLDYTGFGPFSKNVFALLFTERKRCI